VVLRVAANVGSLKSIPYKVYWLGCCLCRL